MNILFLYDERGAGVRFHRQEVPYVNLRKQYPELNIQAASTAKQITENDIKKFNLIHFQRCVSVSQPIEQIIEWCNKHNVATMLDLDDHWNPPSYLPVYQTFKFFDLKNKILKSLQAVDHVISPSNKLIDEIKKLFPKKDVHFIANAIDKKLFEPKDNPSPIMRFGYIAGISHLKDCELLDTSIEKLDNDIELRNKFQIVLGGFDMRESMSYIINGKKIEIPIRNKEKVYVQMEKIMTAKYRMALGYKNFRDFLLEYRDDKEAEFPGIYPYRRLWTMEPHEYHKMYDEIDCSLAPLEDNLFNSCKSNLKVLEAGFKKKCLIVSDVEPYTADCDENNAILIKHKYDWYKQIKYLINNPNKVKDLGESLYEYVNENYEIADETKLRYELYKQFVNNKNK